MIRYSCPFCQKNLKASDRKAGTYATCPGCQQRSRVPAPDAVTGGSSPVPRDPEPSAADREPRRSAAPRVGTGQRIAAFVAGMSPRVKLVLGATAAVALVCFVLVRFAGPSAATAEGERSNAAQHLLMIAGCLSVVAFLVMLHGYGTGCPSCGRWWAKKDTGSDLVDSDTYPRDGAGDKADFDGRDGRAAGEKKAVTKVVTYHHKHECTHCGHGWVTVQVDEYNTTVGRRALDPADESKRPKRRYSID